MVKFIPDPLIIRINFWIFSPSDQILLRTSRLNCIFHLFIWFFCIHYTCICNSIKISQNLTFFLSFFEWKIEIALWTRTNFVSRQLQSLKRSTSPLEWWVNSQHKLSKWWAHSEWTVSMVSTHYERWVNTERKCERKSKQWMHGKRYVNAICHEYKMNDLFGESQELFLHFVYNQEKITKYQYVLLSA